MSEPGAPRECWWTSLSSGTLRNAALLPVRLHYIWICRVIFVFGQVFWVFSLRCDITVSGPYRGSNSAKSNLEPRPDSCGVSLFNVFQFFSPRSFFIYISAFYEVHGTASFIFLHTSRFLMHEVRDAGLQLKELYILRALVGRGGGCWGWVTVSPSTVAKSSQSAYKVSSPP